jgi:hypothetical protein
MGRWTSWPGQVFVLAFFFPCWEETYAEFPLCLPQELDRPLVRVDSVELVPENPIHHVESDIDEVD